jgi:hypothetical protein
MATTRCDRHITDERALATKTWPMTQTNRRPSPMQGEVKMRRQGTNCVARAELHGRKKKTPDT